MKYLIYFVFLLFLTVNISVLQAQDNAKPNIIVIVAEDMRYDELGFLKKTPVETPNLDKLAENSMVFTNAYTTSPVCPASRAGIFTGLPVSEHGVVHFKSKMKKEIWEKSYPVLLREQGYKTGFVGNFGMQIWNQQKYQEKDFDSWFGFPFGWGDYDEHDIDGRPVHSARLMEEQSLRFLSIYKNEPFCLSISFKSPQLPWQIDPAYADELQNADIQFPETWNNKEILPEKAFSGNIYECENLSKKVNDLQTYQDTIRARYQLIYGLDKVVGRIMHELEMLGLLENTLVVFTSDNGFLLGEHGLWGKGWAFEESMRIPLLIYSGKKSKATYSYKLVTNLDIYPTLLNYAGIETGDNISGENILLQTENPTEKQLFFDQPYTRNSESDSWGKIPAFKALISGNLKYVFYPETEEEQLFNIEKDPLETKDLSSSKKYKKELGKLKNTLQND
ncbi:MAG: sulfatase-like hydrolase/transferase [Prolixibacteraceae bacterium]